MPELMTPLLLAHPYREPQFGNHKTLRRDLFLEVSSSHLSQLVQGESLNHGECE